MVNVFNARTGLAAPRSSNSSVLVEPGGAETVSLSSARFAAGVAASMVTVLVLAFVISVSVVALPGGAPADQLLPTCQRPLPELIQRFWARAAQIPANQNRRIDAPRSQGPDNLVFIKPSQRSRLKLNAQSKIK